MVHRTWLSVAPNSAMTFGIAVLTIVVSISTTDCPTHNTTSASHGLVDFVPGVVMASPRVDRHRAGRPTGGAVTVRTAAGTVPRAAQRCGPAPPAGCRPAARPPSRPEPPGRRA